MNKLDNNNIKLEVIRLNNDGYNYSEIENISGISRKSITNFLRKKTYKGWWSENDKPIATGSLHDHHHAIMELSGKCFVFTSAQNNTFVHDKFLESLKQLINHRNAQLIVGTFSYNKSGFQNLQKSDGDWFDPKIEKYILDQPAYIADDLLWCGELNILPTANDPLSGFNSYARNCSAIIPHVKHRLKSLARMSGFDPKFLYTTGCVTQRNYIQKKSGQKASFHHIFGAVIVEVDKDGDWFVRQINADTETGEFYDLDTLYTPNGYTSGHRIEAVNWGDIHSEKYDNDVYSGSFYNTGKSILDVLRPKYQFVHDVFDFQSRNHHNINDPYFRFQMYHSEQDHVEKDIYYVGVTLETMQREWSEVVVVESNHDLALEKWLKTADYKLDPANALFFLECQYETYKAIKNGEKDFSIFEYVVRSRFKNLNNITFLRTDESFVICGENGIECGQHGNNGINGSRGSIQSFQAVGVRMNIGHSHAAGIVDGIYQAGVSGDIEKFFYMKGPNTTSNSHIITYPDSKRTIITMRKEKWRA